MQTVQTIAPERSPSVVQADQFVLSRVIGLIGLGFTTMGVVGYVSNQYREMVLNSGVCLTLGFVGLACLLFHAIRDADPEIRRIYGFLGMLLLGVGTVVSILPAKATDATPSVVGLNFLPWGFFALGCGLLFLVAFVKNETDPYFRKIVRFTLLISAVTFAVIAIYLGIFHQVRLLSSAPLLTVLSLAYFLAYYTEEDTSTGLGHLVGLGQGILGVIAIAFALGNAVGPTVLYEGLNGLRAPNQSMDIWKLIGRGLAILVGLIPVFFMFRTHWPLWLRSTMVALGLAWSGLMIASCTQTGWVKSPPGLYLVPYGIILFGIGCLNVMMSVCVCSESSFVVLTKRELAAMVYSPIVYFVTFANVILAAIGYYLFFASITTLSQTGMPRILPEPIVTDYLSYTWIAAFQVWFLVPMLTMRSFSEELRTGTHEVLVTAPVGDWSIILSKFVATWSIFLLSSIPATVYLVAFRIVGGQPFEFLPVISYLIAYSATGIFFVAMGLFFSSLTSNQIVSGILTAGCMVLMFLSFTPERFAAEKIPAAILVLLRKMSYFSLWEFSLSGSLMIADLMLYLSAGLFMLFLTSKVLEIRKWS